MHHRGQITELAAPRARGAVERRAVRAHPAAVPLDAAGRDGELVRMLASAIESRARTPGDHAARVAERSLAVLRHLGGDIDRDVFYGFLLHDVGLVTVPDAVLLKAGPLDADERGLVRDHPQAGVALLRPLGFSKEALRVVRHHHERFDGEGYPSGLRGARIPLAARVFSVVDTYDAITNARPYRRAMDHGCAVAELRRQAGSQFDPACVEAFVSLWRDLA